ncbi:MAG: electron transfer flavoprotein subunit beta/FixA family protein [Promethearchaeota archaeon]
MKLFVCIKQVPGVTNVKIDPVKGTLIRTGIPSVMNPMDKNGIELALVIKEKMGGEIIAVSMGPPQARMVLTEALAMGADRGYLLSDRKFAGADTLATSYTLSLAIRKILGGSGGNDGDYLVICGEQAIDGDTAQVGPELAEELGIPSITNAVDVEIDGSAVKSKRVVRAGEIALSETRLPALVTVLKEINTPRFPSLQGIVRAFDRGNIDVFSAADLEADESKIGLDGSRTQVWKIFIPEHKEEIRTLSGSIEEMTAELAGILKEHKYL